MKHVLAITNNPISVAFSGGSASLVAPITACVDPQTAKGILAATPSFCLRSAPVVLSTKPQANAGFAQAVAGFNAKGRALEI